MRRTVLVFRHVPHEGLGSIATALRRARLAVRLVDTPRTKRLPDPRRFAGLIVMGFGMLPMCFGYTSPSSRRGPLTAP